MDTSRIAALILVVLGVLGLAYGGFSYTKDRTAAKIGDLELTVKETERINIPAWAGAGALLVGGVLLINGARKS